MRTFGIIGLGSFGFHVARTLAEGGAEVIAIDRDEEKVKAISEIITHAYVADAMDEKALEESGILTVDTVILSVGTNVEASILITVILLNRGIKEIIAKAINPLHELVLRRLGVSRVIFPERDTGVRLARSLLIGSLQEFPFAEGYSIYEMEAPDGITGRSLKELDLRNRYGVNVLVIRRGSEIIVNPKADTIIEEGDTLLILSNDEGVKKLIKL